MSCELSKSFQEHMSAFRPIFKGHVFNSKDGLIYQDGCHLKAIGRVKIGKIKWFKNGRR